MRTHLILAALLAGAVAVSSPSRLDATHPEIADQNVTCTVDGSTVRLSWNIHFFAPIEGWVLSRDGTELAKLPPEATGYTDEDVPDGEHFYELDVINFDGAVGSIGWCHVVVGNFGMECRVDGLLVHLSWGPILIDIAIDEFVIRRNGVVVATVPADRLEYDDRVPGDGVYRYTVHGASFGHEFLIGACTARVRNAGFVCTVSPPFVELDWSRVSLVLNEIAFDFYIIVRNDVIVGRTQETHFRDEPGPGEHHYRVFAVLDGPFEIGDSVNATDSRIRFLVGECKIVMPPLPAPRELTCRLADVLAVANAPFAVVRLDWVNPVRYSSIVVARDGVLLAELPGDAMTYFDRAPPSGERVYSVWGIDEQGHESRRARCSVNIPPTVVPPVRNLTCVGVQISSDGSGAAQLRWENPVEYERIQIARDGTVVATLEGSRTDYVDRGLAPGIYDYAVVGILGGLRSPPRECRVVIDGPPPRNLLYFSSGIFTDVDGAGQFAPIDPFGRIVCLASNHDAMQGWSFGVCSDPRFLRVADVTINATTTALVNDGEGPSFLVIDRFEGGVTMAAVIDTTDPTDTLPPATNHSLLRIAYTAGPEGKPGEAYPVRYCDTLGEPPRSVLFVVRGFEVIPGTLPGRVHLPQLETFLLRGDVDGDGGVGMNDAVSLFNWLFLGGRTPRCMESADINGSGEINLADGVYELQWEFLGSPPPPPPFPRCGPDPAELGCEEPTCPQPQT